MKFFAKFRALNTFFYFLCENSSKFLKLRANGIRGPKNSERMASEDQKLRANGIRGSAPGQWEWRDQKRSQ